MNVQHLINGLKARSDNKSPLLSNACFLLFLRLNFVLGPRYRRQHYKESVHEIEGIDDEHHAVDVEQADMLSWTWMARNRHQVRFLNS
jgi:hypothetical protein